MGHLESTGNELHPDLPDSFQGAPALRPQAGVLGAVGSSWPGLCESWLGTSHILAILAAQSSHAGLGDSWELLAQRTSDDETGLFWGGCGPGVLPPLAPLSIKP